MSFIAKNIEIQVYLNNSATPVVNQIETDTLELLGHMIGDIMESLANAENINWNDEDVTPKEFLDAAVAGFQAIVGNLNSHHLTNLAVQAIEIVEPAADYVASLLQNPERLESLANALIQTIGGLGHMIYEWGTIQEQVNRNFFRELTEFQYLAKLNLVDDLSYISRDLGNLHSMVVQNGREPRGIPVRR